VSLRKYQDGRNDRGSQANRDNIATKNRISFVTEGTETGLSIKDTIGDINNGEVVATLGKSNFTNINPQNVGSKIIFCLDHDELKTFTDNTIHKAAERLLVMVRKFILLFPKAMGVTLK
jgi:hypothetical protein